MDNQKKKRIIISDFIVGLVGMLITKIFLNKSYSYGGIEHIDDSSTIINDTDKGEHDTIKALIINFDKTLTTGECSGEKATQCAYNTDFEVSKNELIKDIKESSHGYLDVEIVGVETLDEFPTYTTKDYSEETKAGLRNLIDTHPGYFEIVSYKNDEIYRFKLTETAFYNTNYFYWEDELVSILSDWAYNYSFDYDYILKEYKVNNKNLIERRNAGEFNQIWFAGMGPTFAYETMMVGRNPYWVNSPGYYADCDNIFMICLMIYEFFNFRLMRSPRA